MYQNDVGRIIGFLGIHVRHLRFDGRPIRLACAGPLVTEPEARRRAAGGVLGHHFFAGPQELSISDGTNDVSRRLAEAGGAQTAYLGSINWTRPLRPASYASDAVLGERRPRWASALRPLCAATDWAVSLPSVMRSFRCHPDYTEAFLRWAFFEMEQVAVRGRLIRSLVRDHNGQVLGWYIYYLNTGSVCWAIQIAAKRGRIDTVIDHLFHHAYTHGGAAVRGRVEPHLLEALSRRRCLLRYYGGSIVHTRDSALLAAALSRDSFLTYLEGEWWMGPHLRLS